MKYAQYLRRLNSAAKLLLLCNALCPQIKSSLFPPESSHEELSSVTLFQVLALALYVPRQKE